MPRDHNQHHQRISSHGSRLAESGSLSNPSAVAVMISSQATRKDYRYMLEELKLAVSYRAQLLLADHEPSYPEQYHEGLLQRC